MGAVAEEARSARVFTRRGEASLYEGAAVSKWVSRLGFRPMGHQTKKSELLNLLCTAGT